jgi:hypothetical protein
MSKQWRLPVALAVVILLGGALIAWLQPAAQSVAYLDPTNTGPQGGHALAAILADRGTQVTRTDAASQTAGTGTTILVTNRSYPCPRGAGPHEDVIPHVMV